MKMIKVILLLTCSIASGLIQANDVKYGSSKKHLITETSLTDEILTLKKKEALLRAIIKDSELIQLKDGRFIDLRDLETQTPKNDESETIDNLNELFMVREGGTGHGG